MSKTTFIDGNKTILDTDYYLKLLGYENQNKELQARNNSLEKRLRHLLESDVIRSFDEVNPKTKEYKYDISILDGKIKEFNADFSNMKDMTSLEIVCCGRRYGKTKLQAEQIKHFIKENNIRNLSIRIIDSETNEKVKKAMKYIENIPLEPIRYHHIKTIYDILKENL